MLQPHPIQNQGGSIAEPPLLASQRLMIIFLLSGFLDGGFSWSVFMIFMPSRCTPCFSSYSSLHFTFARLLPPLVCVCAQRERGELGFLVAGIAALRGCYIRPGARELARLVTPDLARPPRRPPLTQVHLAKDGLPHVTQTTWTHAPGRPASHQDGLRQARYAQMHLDAQARILEMGYLQICPPGQTPTGTGSSPINGLPGSRTNWIQKVSRKLRRHLPCTRTLPSARRVPLRLTRPPRLPAPSGPSPNGTAPLPLRRMTSRRITNLTDAARLASGSARPLPPSAPFQNPP